MKNVSNIINGILIINELFLFKQNHKIFFNFHVLMNVND